MATSTTPTVTQPNLQPNKPLTSATLKQAQTRPQSKNQGADHTGHNHSEIYYNNPNLTIPNKSQQQAQNTTIPAESTSNPPNQIPIQNPKPINHHKPPKPVPRPHKPQSQETRNYTTPNHRQKQQQHNSLKPQTKKRTAQATHETQPRIPKPQIQNPTRTRI